MILEILKYPDMRLFTKAERYLESELNENLLSIKDDMFETMYDSKGIGLSGTQVNIHKKILVMNVTREICMINPEIIEYSGAISFREGCLSFPGIYVQKRRNDYITVEYINSNFEKIIEKFSGIESVCIQHELEHLSGKTFYGKKPKVDM